MPPSKKTRATQSPEPRAVGAARWVHVSELKPDPSNPRINDGLPVQALKDSLRQHGWGAPIVVWLEGGTIVVGHTRLKAALQLFADDKTWTLPDAPGPGLVPVLTCSFTNDQARALLVQDNLAAEASAFDEAALKLTLNRVLSLGSRGLGFNVDELARLVAPPRVVPPPPLAGGAHLGVPEADDDFHMDPAWTQAAPAGELSVGPGSPPPSAEPAAEPPAETRMEVSDGQVKVTTTGAQGTAPAVSVFVQAPRAAESTPTAPPQASPPSSGAQEEVQDQLTEAKIEAGGRSGRHPTLAIGPHRLTVSSDPAEEFYEAIQAYRAGNASLSGFGAIVVQVLRRELADRPSAGG